MAIPKTVKKYLDDKNVIYQVRKHAHTATTLESAYSAHIPAESIAKGVLLKDRLGYVLAVLPARNILDMEVIRYQLDRHLELATEDELGDVFLDCSLGAAPAIGGAYGLKTVVDEALLKQTGLYFEAGDHKELIYVEEPDFEKIMEGATFLEISSYSP